MISLVLILSLVLFLAPLLVLFAGLLIVSGSVSEEGANPAVEMEDTRGFVHSNLHPFHISHQTNRSVPSQVSPYVPSPELEKVKAIQISDVGWALRFVPI